MEFCCLLHLDDYHWKVIISKLSYVDKLSLSKTSKCFFNLIKTKQITYLEEQFKKFYVSQKRIEDVINDFIRKSKLKYLKEIDQCDEFYLEYFFSILKELLSPKLIFAHLFWCQRKYSFKDECKLCCEVKRFYDEVPTIYLHSKHYTDFWDKHTEKVFSDELHFRLEINKTERDCRYFENVYSKHQLVNLFGVIAMCIFFNLEKKYIFMTQFKQKERFYKFFVSESRNIFTVVCDNICVDFIKKVLKELKPFIDYDPTYLKITNSCYIEYLEERKKCT